MVLCNLKPCSANIIQTNHTPPCSKALCHGVGQYEPDWTKDEKNMLKTRIIHISDMTLTLTQKYGSRSQHIIYPKTLCGLSFSQNRPREERISYREEISWTDTQKDAHTDHYRLHEEQGPILYSTFVIQSKIDQMSFHQTKDAKLTPFLTYKIRH